MAVSEPDPYLVGHIQDALASDPRVGELGIHVDVVGDTILLTGSVTSEERRTLVGVVVAELGGGRAIQNQIGVVLP